MPINCPKCATAGPDVLEVRADQRRRYSCNDCGHVWLGEAVAPARIDTYATARATFPGPDRVAADRLARVQELKTGFLEHHPEVIRGVPEFWARYQEIFSKEGLGSADPKELHYFANVETGARPGNMSVFNLEWTALGPEEGARRVRESVHHLLYGPQDTPMEDRLTELLQPNAALGMKGWKESLLTKVLCIMHPDRFLPILTYSSPNGGKRELARKIWGLELPDPQRTTWTIGRLVFWSNDLLMNLAGEGFLHATHVSQFMWTVKDQPVTDRG